MTFEHLQPMFRSLRFRLSAWNTAAVLLIVALTLVSVREALRFTLLRENDLLLQDDATEVISSIERFYPNMPEIFNEMDRKAASHLDRGLFVQLLDPRGDSLWHSGKLPNLNALEPSEDVRSHPVTLGHDRLVQRILDRPGLPRYTVRIGASLAMVEGDVTTVTRLMIAAGAMIFIVAPFGGYWLAGRATRPLARIIATAARLRPSHMEERLPIRGTQDELDQLSSTINRFLDLLRDYLERNREFVANAAHELRSPLAAVQSSVEVALNSDRPMEEYQDLLGEIADQCGQLRILVNQLLLLAETDTERAQIDRRPLRIDQLVEKSVEMFRGAAEERGIALSADTDRPITVDGDAGRLRQVVNNLIDNSLKFTPRDGRVRVTLQHDAAANQLVMRVIDTGMGIGKDELPHVFERFYRGDKSRQRENIAYGNGLGLSICQSIVTAHDGTITAEPNRGPGVTFIVRLPMTPHIDEIHVEPDHAGHLI